MQHWFSKARNRRVCASGCGFVAVLIHDDACPPRSGYLSLPYLHCYSSCTSRTLRMLSLSVAVELDAHQARVRRPISLVNPLTQVGTMHAGCSACVH